uniref:Resolvase/invertase-type recombinase catalytic domain-containing protein n=1 Tax=Haemonchus contortus TaxID=6289 RepID=A0A7I4YB39_HAECO
MVKSQKAFFTVSSSRIVYADGIALLAEAREKLQGKLQEWRMLKENGLRLNVKKSKDSDNFLKSEECTKSIADGLGELMRGYRTSNTEGPARPPTVACMKP